MIHSRELARLRRHLQPPRPTVRLRLTLLYGGLFLISGTGLLATMYLLLRAGHLSISTHPSNAASLPPSAGGGAGRPIQTEHPVSAAHQVSSIDLHQILVPSAIALAIMAVVSIGLGWLVAGRVLRPLRTITTAARDISANDLHQRLALDGPDDELRELGSTLNELLNRLEASFKAQRQFVANASHELRTPLARQRTLIEIALGDPHATVQSLQANNQRVLAAGEQQERLIEALLTLARSERGLDHRESLDLAAITSEVLASYSPEARRRGVQIEIALAAAPSSGDRRLIERLIANLVDNAIRYNTPSGRVVVHTALETGKGIGPDNAVLTVTNSGPVIPAPDAERLLRPFQRLEADRRAHSDGTGLGLSIACAIAAAHGGTLTARPQPCGGLRIEVGLPTTTPRTNAYIVSSARLPSNQDRDVMAAGSPAAKPG
jgi:signal transduction histidine kinase